MSNLFIFDNLNKTISINNPHTLINHPDCLNILDDQNIMLPWGELVSFKFFKRQFLHLIDLQFGNHFINSTDINKLTKNDLDIIYKLFKIKYGKDDTTLLFTNHNCKYFPCHKNISKTYFNCKYCFCPLYFLNGDCGGEYTFTSNGIKDCSKCILPHNGCEGLAKINNVLTEYLKG